MIVYPAVGGVATSVEVKAAKEVVAIVGVDKVVACGGVTVVGPGEVCGETGCCANIAKEAEVES